MATEGVYNGSELRILLDDNTVYHATSCAISLSRGTKERATKDTDGIEVSLDKLSWSATGDGLAVAALPSGVTSADNTEALFDKIVAGTLVTVKYTLGSSGETGDTYYTGSAYITALDVTAAVDEDATASFTLTGTGAVTKAVLS
ncbi:phage tail tube protein [Mesoflavibacter profundi]|uniref:phage tail tube protein n=1 Tax=Mesoflavibacter profundi TaxID=2708110 RepID=UPI0035145D56